MDKIIHYLWLLSSNFHVNDNCRMKYFMSWRLIMLFIAVGCDNWQEWWTYDGISGKNTYKQIYYICRYIKKESRTCILQYQFVYCIRTGNLLFFLIITLLFHIFAPCIIQYVKQNYFFSCIQQWQFFRGLLYIKVILFTLESKNIFICYENDFTNSNAIRVYF